MINEKSSLTGLAMNDLPVMGDLCYMQGSGIAWGSTSGIARGQTLQVARKKCLRQSCVFVKRSDFGQRITHFLCDFVRHGGH